MDWIYIKDSPLKWCVLFSRGPNTKKRQHYTKHGSIYNPDAPYIQVFLGFTLTSPTSHHKLSKTVIIKISKLIDGKIRRKLQKCQCHDTSSNRSINIYNKTLNKSHKNQEIFSPQKMFHGKQEQLVFK